VRKKIEKTTFACPVVTVRALVDLLGFTGPGAVARAIRFVIDSTLAAAGRHDACSGNQDRIDGRKIAGTEEAKAKAQKAWAGRRARRAELERLAQGKKAKSATASPKKIDESAK
jgi:hypothetical protein